MIKPCVFVPHSVVKETLNTPPTDGKNMLEPLTSLAKEQGLPLTILEDRQVVNTPEVHRHEADLWICISGEVDFTVGGVLEDPEVNASNDRELKAKKIVGGTQYTLHVGDILFIPAGQPHCHATKNEGRLFIIKIPSVEVVPLSEVPGWK